MDLFRDFCRAYFNFPGAFSIQDLKNQLAPEIRRILAGYVAGRRAADLHRADLTAPLGALLQESLERFLFDGASGPARSSNSPRCPGSSRSGRASEKRAGR